MNGHLEATEAQAQSAAENDQHNRHLSGPLPAAMSDHVHQASSMFQHNNNHRIVVETVTQLEAEADPEPVQELTGCAGSCLCNPTSWGHNIIGIFFMCLMGFGSYLCYDNPSALIDQYTSALNISSVEFGMMYSLYSWPNVVLPIFGGYLIDEVFGLRVAAVFFCVFIVLGQFISAIGAFVNSYVVIEISRFIFGLGGESLAVAQSTYAAAWFKGNALNAVFGLQLSISRVGSTVCLQTAVPIYNAMMGSVAGSGDDPQADQNRALGYTLLILGVSTVVSSVAACIIGWMDKRKSTLTGTYLEEQPKVNLREVLSFPLSVWLVCFVCVSFYLTIFPFVSYGKKFYEERFGFDDTNANFINGLIYLMSAFAAPVFGFSIDRVGLNVYFVLMANLLTLLGHCLVGFTLINPYVGVALIGCGYSLLAASLWPIIALIVPQHRQGTAYGVVQAVQNLGLATVTLLIGWIVENLGYYWLEVFNAGLLVAAILGTLALLWISKVRHMSYLHMTTKKRDFFETTQAYFDMMQKASGGGGVDTAPLAGGNGAGVDNPNYVADEGENGGYLH